MALGGASKKVKRGRERYRLNMIPVSHLAAFEVVETDKGVILIRGLLHFQHVDLWTVYISDL